MYVVKCDFCGRSFSMANEKVENHYDSFGLYNTEHEPMQIEPFDCGECNGEDVVSYRGGNDEKS